MARPVNSMTRSPTRPIAADTTVRLDKHVSECLGISRKHARALVRSGRIRVDGEVIRDFSSALRWPAPGEGTRPHIRFDHDTVEPPPDLLLFHKPPGVLTSMGDPRGRPNLATVLPEVWRDQLHPVGRLDAETRGLLLFSRHGSFTQRILHPRRAIEREYVARTVRPPTEELPAILAGGVRTADGIFTARVIERQGDTVRLVVTEGKHRMVRRLLANTGHPVLDLLRVRFGEFELGELAEGEWRHITPAEANFANELLGERIISAGT